MLWTCHCLFKFYIFAPFHVYTEISQCLVLEICFKVLEKFWKSPGNLLVKMCLTPELNVTFNVFILPLQVLQDILLKETADTLSDPRYVKVIAASVSVPPRRVATTTGPSVRSFAEPLVSLVLLEV